MVNEKKGGKSKAITSSFYAEKEKLTEEEFLVNMIKQVTARLKKEYHYSSETISELGAKEAQLLIPIQIFAAELAPSEALVKYLKEEHDLNYHEISELINRNERGVWASYQRAKKKMPSKFDIKEPIMIPISVFANKKFSILECLITHLKDVRGVKGAKIAKLLNKHPANIWTIYNRANKKLGKSK